MDRRIYFVGNNKYGEFGWNHEDSIKQLTQINYKQQHKFTNILCGRGYDIYCDDRNNIYYCIGYNHHGQCTITNKRITNEFIEITKFKQQHIKINKICCNVAGFSIFWITNNNKIYCNGWNKYYQLGIDNDNINTYKPRLIPNNTLKYPIDIKSGNTFSIALCSLNHLIINYWADKYIIHTNRVPNDIINLLISFNDICNKIYITGQLYTNAIIHTKWTEIKEFDQTNIVRIATGSQHCLLMSLDGALWSMGKNNEAQIATDCWSWGLWDHQHPAQISWFKRYKIKIKDISCGFHHNLVLDCMGNIYSWGQNDRGQCAVNTFSRVLEPQLVVTLKNKSIEYIKCGAYHSYAMTRNNEHYLWGCNCQNECISNDKRTCFAIPNLINDSFLQQTEIIDVCLGVCNTKLMLNCDLENNNLKINGQKTIFEKKSAMQKSDKFQGKCLRFLDDKGYGFISLNDNLGDIFVHKSDIYSNCFPVKLYKDEIVEFKMIIYSDGRRQAIDVTAPNCKYVKEIKWSTDIKLIYSNNKLVCFHKESYPVLSYTYPIQHVLSNKCLKHGFTINPDNGWMALLYTNYIYIFEPLNGTSFQLRIKEKISSILSNYKDLTVSQIRFINDEIFILSFKKSLLYVLQLIHHKLRVIDAIKLEFGTDIYVDQLTVHPTLKHLRRSINKENCCISKKYGIFYISNNKQNIYQSVSDHGTSDHVISTVNDINYNQQIKQFCNIGYDETFGISGRLLLYCTTNKSQYVLYQMFNYNELIPFVDILQNKCDNIMTINVLMMLYGNDILDVISNNMIGIINTS